MSTKLTDSEIARFNSLFEKGTDLQKNLIILDGARPKHPDSSGQSKLKGSIHLLKEALKIHPGSWQAMYLIGKAYQAMEDLELALSWFRQAIEIEPENPSVAREAGLSAGQLGRHDEAIRLMKAAASIHRGDAGLQCNMGLSYLMSGRAGDAAASFALATKADPENKTNRKLLKLAEQVADGKVSCPRTEEEILNLV